MSSLWVVLAVAGAVQFWASSRWPKTAPVAGLFLGWLGLLAFFTVPTALNVVRAGYLTAESRAQLVYGLILAVILAVIWLAVCGVGRLLIESRRA